MYLKVLLSAFCAFVLFSGSVFGQKEPRFGKIDKSDLEGTHYPKDSSAAAVILFRKAITNFDLANRGFIMKTDYFTRVKILTEEGLSEADIAIPYYNPKNAESDRVLAIDGNTYNLVNGKVVKESLSKKYIFDERVSDLYSRKKISFPSVKPGSIIEYKYTEHSLYFYKPSSWLFQNEDFPVVQSKYSITIPSFFTYNVELKGSEYVQQKEKESETILKHYGIYTNTLELNYTSDSLPALRDEPYVWNVDDYLTKLSFELESMEIPGYEKVSYTSSWKTVDENLLESNFGKMMKRKSPISEEVKKMAEGRILNDSMLLEVLELVKSNVGWNKRRTIHASNLKDVIKDGVGSSADLNFLFLSTLNEIGFNAYPVLMRTKSLGMLPLTHPSITSFNHVITGVDLGGKPVFIDASSSYGGINILPVDCLVERARAYTFEKGGEWMDLSNLGRNVAMQVYNVEFNNDGVLKGTSKYSGKQEYAYVFRQNMEDNEKNIVEKLSSKYDMIITNYSAKNVSDFGSTVEEEFFFEKKLADVGNVVYLNPMMVTHISENPFKLEVRKLPIDFNYPYDYRQIVSLKIPDDYQIEEMPKSVNYNFKNNDIRFSYIIVKTENTIQLTYRFTLNKPKIGVKDYSELRDFWGKVVAKNMEQIVLKKK